jgi:hypothetical protein
MVLFNSDREKSTFGYGFLCGWLLAIVIFLVVCHGSIKDVEELMMKYRPVF